MNVKHTQGGLLGHYFRRMIHVVVLLAIPLIYYAYGHDIASWLGFTERELVLLILTLILILEVLRLHFELVIFGQHEYEKKQVSSFAWGGIAVGLVLLFTSRRYAIPIIWSCALGDPLLGELRRYSISESLVWIIGCLVILMIWLFCYWWIHTPWWWAIIMSPLIVASEKPKLKWIDDNALMQFVPLILITVVNFIIHK